MEREELWAHLDDLSPTEQTYLASPVPGVSSFYQALEAEGLKDSNGVYHLPRMLLKRSFTNNVPTAEYFWRRLDRSPYQSIFFLKKRPVSIGSPSPMRILLQFALSIAVAAKSIRRTDFWSLRKTIFC